MSHFLHALEDGEHLAALLLAPALAALQLVHHLPPRSTISGGREQKANDEHFPRKSPVLEEHSTHDAR